jgi:hypothetical protein
MVCADHRYVTREGTARVIIVRQEKQAKPTLRWGERYKKK